jgi:hypothetical protein
MTEIHKAATSVFAWLGPPADDSDVAMDAIESIGEAAIKAGASDLSPDVLFNLWDPDLAGVLDSIKHPFQGLSQNIAFEFPQVATKSLSERSY